MILTDSVLLTYDLQVVEGGEPGVGVDLTLVLPTIGKTDVTDLQLPGPAPWRHRHGQPRVGAEDEAADSQDGHVGQPEPGHQVVGGQPSEGTLQEGRAVLHHSHTPGHGQELRSVLVLQAASEHRQQGGRGRREGRDRETSHTSHAAHYEENEDTCCHLSHTNKLHLTDGQYRHRSIIVTSQCP